MDIDKKEFTAKMSVISLDEQELGSRVVSLAEAKRELTELCNQASYGGETIVVTKRGKPLAAIVGVADLKRYLLLDDKQALRTLEHAVATSQGTVRATRV